MAEAISTFSVTVKKTDLSGGRIAVGHPNSAFFGDGDGPIINRTTIQDSPPVMVGKLARRASVLAL